MYMDLLHVVCMCAACILFDHAVYLIVQELGHCDGQALSYLQMLSFFLAFYNQMGIIFTLTPLSHRKTKVHCLYIGPRLSALSTKVN